MARTLVQSPALGPVWVVDLWKEAPAEAGALVFHREELARLKTAPRETWLGVATVKRVFGGGIVTAHTDLKALAKRRARYASRSRWGRGPAAAVLPKDFTESDDGDGAL